jgi:hypothetical protein
MGELDTPKVDHLRDIVRRSKSTDALNWCIAFDDVKWLAANAAALLREIEYLEKFSVSNTLVENMKAMVEQAAPEIQEAMRQLRDKLETVTAERDQALAREEVRRG